MVSTIEAVGILSLRDMFGAGESMRFLWLFVLQDDLVWAQLSSLSRYKIWQ